VMWLGAFAPADGDPTADMLKDAGRQVAFFESTTFNKMAPKNSLKNGVTKYVMAKEGECYILYTESSGEVGVKAMQAGTWSFTWLDVINGTKKVETKAVTAGDQKWNRPSGIGNECAVYISKSSGAAGNIPPVANDKKVITEVDQEIYIQLETEDNDGPGPITFEIIKQPAHGTLSGANNDITYTPDKGFSGEDSFQWKANDGKDDSRTATVTIIVEAKAPVIMKNTVVHAEHSFAALYSRETKYLTITVPYGKGCSFKILSPSGAVMLRTQLEGKAHYRVSLADWPKGLYIALAEIEGITSAAKIPLLK